MKEIYKPLGEKYEEYKKIKSEYDACEQKKQNLEINQNQLIEVKNQLCLATQRNSIINENILKNRDKIIANPNNFFIPYKTELGDINRNTGHKTNICKFCQCNCHTPCRDLIKNFCKAFDFKFNCKICPNRCPASLHEIVTYELPKYIYKTIDQIFPNNFSTVNEKIELAISSLLKENKEVKQKIIHIDTDLEVLKEKIEKSKEEKVDMSKIKQELNQQCYAFKSGFVYDFQMNDIYDAELFKLFLFCFMKIEELD